MNCLKLRLLALLTFFIGGSVTAQDLRSDTVDLLHHHIKLDITDLAGKRIQGSTAITFTPIKNGVSTVRFDLLKMNIDSVLVLGGIQSHTYNDTLLHIQLGNSYGIGDTLDAIIYYKGQPVKDASNWGGFYFQSGHAFNLGVGFDADPHNFGRAWFPCFDNFIERSTYSFDIITSGGRKAYCNGELTGEQSLIGDTLLRTWEMLESIPSYLVGVAVGPYSEVNWDYQGIQSQIPVQLAVKAADSVKLKNSFIHLNDAMDAFESYYGPFLFNKVGFSVVPFNSGAMEHASNVAYPSNAVNGTTGSEGLMAHELSHHWWGNLVTCDRQEDMWINEGWASYSAHLFFEHVYGRDAYLDAVKENHLDVIQYAHFKEGKYWAVSGVPHEHTYGTHVYDKGASVAHNLRAYLGDSLFFDGIKSFMNEYKFKDVNSALLRDKMSGYSGVDLTDFFDDWVFGSGYTNMSIDSFNVVPGSVHYSVDVYVKQKQRGSDHFFNNVPVTIRFMDKNFNELKEPTIVSGEFSHLQFILPFEPVMLSLNSDDKLAMAVTADEAYVSGKETFEFTNAKFSVDVLNVSKADSALLRIEHHWAAPDDAYEPANSHRISNYRYWKVDGINLLSTEASGTIEFDGRTSLSGGGGHLDDELLKNGSDSIILLYRKKAGDSWWEYQYYTKVAFSGVPFGRMELSKVLPGEYTFANGFSAIGIKEQEGVDAYFSIVPNPVQNELTIRDASNDSSSKDIYIFTIEGKLIHRSTMNGNKHIDVSTFKNGNYLINILKGERTLYSSKFIVAK